MTSIVVNASSIPWDVVLLASGVEVPFSTPPLDLGGGWNGDGPTHFWRFSEYLEPSTNYVVKLGADELTHFTTAPAYDKNPGTPPKLKSLELWRVRYPLDWVGSGNCVFSEYHGCMRIDWDPAVIDATQPSAIVYEATLLPKSGGPPQRFVFTGDVAYDGQAPAAPDYICTGAFSPEREPTREYCLTLKASGNGDLAKLPATSESVCAKVTEIVVSKNGSPAGLNDGSGDEGGGGCHLGSVANPRRGWGGVLALALMAGLFRRLATRAQ